VSVLQIKFNNWEKYNKRQRDIKRPFWFAMSNNLFLDPFFIDLADDEKITFIYLLCEASQVNKFGECEVSEQKFTRLVGYNLQTLYKTIDKLLKSGVAAGSRRDRGGMATATEQNRTVQDKNLSDPADRTEVAEKWDLEEIYRAYPKRLGDMKKKAGLARVKKLVTSRAKFDEVLRAVKTYAAYCQAQKLVGTEKVKMFASFFDSHGDWKEWAEKKTVEKKIIMNADEVTI
jgi:hypothetical protein